MRVLFFTHYFPPEGNAPASRTFENCRRWVAQGHQVTVVTCTPNSPIGIPYPGHSNKLFQREELEGIQVCRVWTYLAANKGVFHRTTSFVSFMLSATICSLFLRRPDVIIATSPQFFCGWAGIFVSWLKWRPLILEIRDIWPESISAVGAMRNRWVLGILEFLEKMMYTAANHIVTVGAGYRHKLLERNVPANKISIVTNGADTKFFRPMPPDTALSEEYHLRDKFVCASIGTLGLSSGLQIVPKTAEILRQRKRNDIVFMLVGDGAIGDELKQMVHQMGLTNVIMTGRQNKDRIPAYLSISDVCLAHLQRRELFQTVIPSKIFEAMAMGKPILLGVEGFAAELVEHAGAGVCFEPDNAEQLADVVEQLAGDHDRLKQFAAAGESYVRENFNWDNLSREYLEIVECTLRAGKNR
ncbi:MAG: glycosyltransferase family 4 protein [Planctomycetaceae bacterium]|nr:glycosyltransferase family 4 protein [Planctomycetaceae bacterium]